MWGECILYMPATESAKRMSNEYFYEKKQHEEKMQLQIENERLHMEITRLKEQLYDKWR